MRLLPLILLNCWVHASHSIDVQQQPFLDSLRSPASPASSLLELHQALVEHESTSGNEYGVTEWLVSYLRGRNFTVETQEVNPATPTQGTQQNVLAYAGSQRRTRTLLTSHVDTVPPYWPYERKGDEIWGRGSVDAKGSVATQITAVEELLAADQIGEGDVALLFVTGEENGGRGMAKANELGLQWDAVIFGEPTELKLGSGHKGALGLQITAKGKAGHSGYPELGKNAINLLVPVLYAIQNAELPGSEKYGNTTLNIGRIDGGVAANVIPEDAYARIAIRVAAETTEVVRDAILDAIHDVPEGVDLTFLGPGHVPVHLDSDVEGFETIVLSYGTDIPNLIGDHKRYLYGPGSILVAHSDHEHLKVSDLEAAVRGYKALIEHSLEQ